MWPIQWEAFIFNCYWLNGVSGSNGGRSGGGSIGLSNLGFVLNIGHLKYFGSMLGEGY